MRIRTLVAPLVVVVAMASGCSGSAPGGPMPAATTAPSQTVTPAMNDIGALTADEILSRSKAALNVAPSFHVTLSGTVGSVATVFDLVYVGGNAKGTKSSQGQVTEVIRLGPNLYVRAGDGFWSTHVPLQQIALLSGKWVRVDATNPNYAGLAPPVDGYLSVVGALTKVGPTTIDGKAVITLKSIDGITLHVLAQGEPYPRRIEAVVKSSAGVVSEVIDFTDFGTVVTSIEAPTGKTVDLSTG